MANALTRSTVLLLKLTSYQCPYGLVSTRPGRDVTFVMCYVVTCREIVRVVTRAVKKCLASLKIRSKFPRGNLSVTTPWLQIVL